MTDRPRDPYTVEYSADNGTFIQGPTGAVITKLDSPKEKADALNAAYKLGQNVGRLATNEESAVNAIDRAKKLVQDHIDQLTKQTQEADPPLTAAAMVAMTHKLDTLKGVIQYLDHAK